LSAQQLPPVFSVKRNGIVPARQVGLGKDMHTYTKAFHLVLGSDRPTDIYVNDMLHVHSFFVHVTSAPGPVVLFYRKALRGRAREHNTLERITRQGLSIG